MSSRFPVSGVLVVDKAEGLSSNHCLQRAKRLLGADKAGHTGSLDPLACGVLPLRLIALVGVASPAVLGVLWPWLAAAGVQAN